jgi:hypothetical protein
MKTFALVGLLAAPLLVSAASAVTFTSVAFDGPLAPGQTLRIDFDNPNAPGYSIVGGALFQGSTPVVAAAPAGDATKYMALTNGKSATLTMPYGVGSMSVYIGSIDTYNHIEFFGSDGYYKKISGIDMTTAPNGSWTGPLANRRFYFDFGTTPISKIVFSSTGNSFEFDSIATGTVPEPGTWAMLIAGFGLTGLAMRRRRKGDFRAVMA